MIRVLTNVGLVFGSTLLALILAVGILEAYLRLAVPREQIEHPGIYQAHPVWGYSYVPGLTFHVSHSEFTSDLTIDELGFRRSVRGVSGPGSEEQRIVILGDSFMAGLSIPDGEVFAHQLERRMPEASVWNIAAEGWGTNNQRAALETLLPRLRPTEVLVAFYENDLFNNTQPIDRYFVIDGHLIDKFCPNTPQAISHEVVDGIARRYRAGDIDLGRARKLVRQTCSGPLSKSILGRLKAMLHDRLRAYPVLVDSLKPLVLGLIRVAPGAGSVLGNLVDLETGPKGSGFPQVREVEVEATRRELAALRELCARGNCQLSLMLIPSKWSLALPENPYLANAKAIAQELGLPTLDLTDAVIAAGGSALYWNKDGHLRPKGHEVMAEMLLRQPWWAGPKGSARKPSLNRSIAR